MIDIKYAVLIFCLMVLSISAIFDIAKSPNYEHYETSPDVKEEK